MDKSIEHHIAHYLHHHANTVLLVLDEHGVIVHANTHAVQSLGAALFGMKFSELVVDFTHSFSIDAVLSGAVQHARLDLSSERGLPHTFEVRFYHTDDGRIVALGESEHRYDALLQENLIQLNSEFSNLSRELQKKTVELEKLNELKNRFIGTAAHDLRNPIGAIRNLAEYLQDEMADRLDAEQKEILSVIRDSGNSMLVLLDDLLNVVRIESGNLDLDIKPHDLTGFVEQSIKINRIFAVKRNIRITLNHDETLPVVSFDSAKLEQVMNNLLTNAIKYSPEGGAVTVSLDNDGESVTVSIRDEGPGISRKEQSLLFKPFSRTSNPVPPGETSTGLGLAIARNIVEGHHGEIGVASEPGAGSLFYFSLPLDVSTNVLQNGRNPIGKNEITGN